MTPADPPDRSAPVPGPRPPAGTDSPDPERLPAAIERATGGGASPAERVAALREVAVGLGRRVASPRGLLDTVLQVAPHLTVRDAPTLSAHHDGLVGRDLAHALVTSAVRGSAGIGAAGGVLASASEAAPAALLSAPVQLGVESLAVVALELRLVAELHAALGVALPTEAQQRAALVLRAWTTGRGVRLADLAGGGGVSGLLGRAARSQLRDRLLRRFARSTLGFIPLLAGAAAGAAVNARGTRKLGEGLIADLSGVAAGGQ